MSYFQLTLICLICVAKSYGQTGDRHYCGIDVEITKEKRPKRIHTKVHLTSAFLPGDSSWVRSMEEILDRSIPVKSKARAGTYLVSVRFLIERDGSVADMACLKDPGFGMCGQVLAAIRKKFPSKWLPQTGPPVPERQYHTTIMQVNK